MKFTELEPQFLRLDPTDNKIRHHVDSIEDAQGVSFKCPVCFVKNKGTVGTHSILCWSSSRGTPPDVTPGPGRWTLEGTNYQNLTLGCEPNKSRSVLLHGSCAAHFYVTNGEIQPA